MRFLEKSTDVPDELIDAVTGGRAVFLCGAGVSMQVGLPSFKELTEQIYARLGETFDNEPAEQMAFENGEYDRVLRSLEKRTHLVNYPSRVRATAATLLGMAGNVEVRYHRILIDLSRDQEGRVRLLTTNFDTLFEHAASSANLEVPSYAGRTIPRPGSTRDFGILHLHGRIADQALGLDESDLVLTSADFGEAYLRSGWASRYIEDRMRLNTLVLVGYSAEDVALRLLLETLDADRGRFPDLNTVYAIGKRTDGSASVWRAKGIRPIEFSNYSEMYKTLEEWARYASNPANYARERITSILTGSMALGEEGI